MDKNKKKASFRRSPGFPSLISLVPLAPQALAFVGTPGVGYPVYGAGSPQESVKNFFVNELMLFTGYDANANNWNFGPAVLNYFSIFASKLVKRYFKGIRIGPLRIT